MEFNPNLPETSDYLSLFLNDTPFIDVRSPIEFNEGQAPNATNIPLMSDQERHQIGLRYKQQGQDAAIKLGLQLVSGETKQQRIGQWIAFAQQNPQGALYCFRGGLRSKTSQQWLYEATGIHYPRVKGGYKQLRQFLSEQLIENAKIMRPVIVAGATGSGKTELLKTVQPRLDLEGLANHRGSAFGRYALQQPTQSHFENALSQALLKIIHKGNPYYVTEDESSNIGARHIPASYFAYLNQAPVIILQASLEERISLTLREYVHNSLQEYQTILQDKDYAFITWTHYLFNSLERIQKRLGNVLYTKIHIQMQKAIHDQQKNGRTDLHKAWIHSLLVDYYDKMYHYQLDKKDSRVVFQGSKMAVLDCLAVNYGIK
jgi:tRNA 2-selenouridine synthase